ncbi:MAG: hypothetical protein E6R04_04775 [Spirochaetes bacterium]|nr:MAG: hypothetical protein E6R04_04775 [Spirochaetota bacterium]
MVAKRFTNVDQFTSDNVAFAGAAASGDAVASETKNVDYSVPFDACLTGAVVIVQGAKIDDKVSLQVVHPTYGVLNEFVTDWFMADDQSEQFALQLNYPANVPAGLTIRAVYKATADEGTRKVRINYFLHKVVEQV